MIAASLCILCVLCLSVVDSYSKLVNHRVTENTEVAQRKTVYVDLLDLNTGTSDGSYDRPFKSWRAALQHVGSGDTIIAKNGDYRKAGAQARWGGLTLTLTLEDKLEPGDPHPQVKGRPDTTGIYRYDPKNPLIIRAETKHGVIIDHIRFHLAQGIVIDGFDIFPNPYYRDASGKKLNSRRNGIHGDSVYEPEDSFNRVKTNDPPGGYTSSWYDRTFGPVTSRFAIAEFTMNARPLDARRPTIRLQDDDRLYLIKFNQSHHITIEDNELFDGKNYQRKPAIDLPCVDDVIVRRNIIRNSHRGVVSKGGGSRV
jgi:hypothetical protein